jgi:nicotinate-nucleotide--dimethylbenzimidazole phosphoribosyltransferase
VNTSASPFASLNSLRDLLRRLPSGSDTAAARAREREPELTKPPGSLGRLEELAEWLARWQGRHPPAVEKPAIIVFAGRHGVVSQGVSAFPAEVTDQMIENFRQGGAAINQLSRVHDASLNVVDVAPEQETGDFTEGPAMTTEAMLGAMVKGVGAVPDDADLLCLGEMGIGNTTAGAALCTAVFGGRAEDWVGPGTGVSGDALARKTDAVRRAVERHRNETSDSLDFLCRLGGFELAAIAGAIVGARVVGIPVVLDGYTCCAAAAVLLQTHPNVLDHCQVGHLSAEPGHKRLLDRIGKSALLEFNMRLGEASGAALTIGILRSAVACHTGMATFDEAGVSQ